MALCEYNAIFLGYFQYKDAKYILQIMKVEVVEAIEGGWSILNTQIRYVYSILPAIIRARIHNSLSKLLSVITGIYNDCIRNLWRPMMLKLGALFLFLAYLVRGKKDSLPKWPMVSYFLHEDKEHPANMTRRLFNLGMSKSGSTSLGHYLTCRGLRGKHYNNCNGVAGERNLCAYCLTRSIDKKVPIEEECGAFDFLAEFNYKAFNENGNSTCIFPSFQHLEKIDKAYPGSKFFMPMRPVEDWYSSAKHWGNSRLFFSDPFDS